MSQFKFTEYNQFESDGLINCLVSFAPAVTIKCQPPYTKGKKDSSWIKYRKGNKPKSKEALETCLGMSIESWE